MTRIQLRTQGHHVKTVKPLPEDEAVKSGAELLSEGLVLVTGVSAILAEFIRKSKADERAAREKEIASIKEKQEKELRAIQRDLQLRERLQALEERIVTAEGAKITEVHNEMVTLMTELVSLNESMLNRLDQLERSAGITPSATCPPLPKLPPSYPVPSLSTMIAQASDHAVPCNPFLVMPSATLNTPASTSTSTSTSTLANANHVDVSPSSVDAASTPAPAASLSTPSCSVNSIISPHTEQVVAIGSVTPSTAGPTLSTRSLATNSIVTPAPAPSTSTSSAATGERPVRVAHIIDIADVAKSLEEEPAWVPAIVAAPAQPLAQLSSSFNANLSSSSSVSSSSS